MTEESATQTVYVRTSTKKALQHLALWLPPQTHGRYTHATQDDAIRFLLKEAGIDIEDTQAMIGAISRLVGKARER